MPNSSKLPLLALDKYTLFLYRGEVWRSLGKLNPDSHMVTAQKVGVTEDGTELCLQNADFTESMLVEGYISAVPLCKNKHGHTLSDYECNKYK